MGYSRSAWNQEAKPVFHSAIYKHLSSALPSSLFMSLGYCLRARGGPLTRFPFKSTVTSTRSAILMKGMPLFIP